MAKPSTLVREYSDAGDFQKDANKLSRDGWTVANQSSQAQKKGCLKAILSPFTRKKDRIIVTYRREA